MTGPARFAALDPGTLYAILRLRVDVFVVEQRCAYPELDGLDVLPTTWHLWSGDVDAYLRVLCPVDAPVRIGRVVAARAARGRGLAGELMGRALTLVGAGPVVLSAQAPLVGFYARHGFAPAGPEFVEDGIPHVPMSRP